MKTNKITVGIERTINLGNYENVRYSVLTEVSLEEGETADKVYQDRLDWCKAKVMAELERLQGKQEQKPKRLG